MKTLHYLEMSLLENPTVKRVLMVVVALAVVAAVAYVIYHFTAGSEHGETSTTMMPTMAPTMMPTMAPTMMPTDAPTEPSMEGFDTMPPTQQHQEEGFAGCPAREGFADPMPAENQQESVAKPLAADNTLGMNQMPSECYPKDVLSSVDLLPSDANSHYAMVNPNGQGALSDQNFLTAGYHIGINTVGQTLRNANRQLRSDPPCPQVAVSPWNNTTIEYDGNRRPLEIGGAP